MNRVRWTFSAPGGAALTPCVAGGLVFISKMGDPAARYIALDQAAGTPKWQLPGPISIQSPIHVDQGVAYFALAPDLQGSTSTINAVDAQTGQPLWTFATSTYVNFLVAAGFAYYTIGPTLFALRASDRQVVWSITLGSAGVSVDAPAIGDDALYCHTSDGFIVSVRRDTGVLVWKLAVGSNGSGAIAVSPDGVLFGVDTQLWKVTIPTGQILWQVPASDQVIYRPAVRDGTVYFCDVFGLYAVRSSDGGKLWSYTPATYPKHPVLANDLVLIASPTALGGASPGLLIAVGANDGKERWRVQTDSLVPTAPVVDSGMVYAGSGAGTVYAIDLHLAWSFPTKQPLLASAAFSDGAIYFGGIDAHLYRIDPQAGAELWSYATRAPINTEPLVDPATVYLAGGDHFLYALDRTSGHLRWKTDLGVPGISRPALTEASVCVSASDGRICGLNPPDGVIQWTYDAGQPAWLARDAIAGIVFAAMPGTVLALGAGGKLKWATQMSVSFQAPPVAGTVFLFAGGADGKLYAFDLQTGALQWQFDSGSPIYAAAVASNGVVYFGNAGGLVFALDQPTGSSLWKFALPRGFAVNANPALSPAAPPALCVGSDDGWAYILDPRTGTLLWTYPTGGAVRGCTASAAGMFYNASSDGSLYAIG